MKITLILFSVENYLEMSLRYKHMNTISLDLSSPLMYIVMMNLFCTYGDGEDNSLNDSSVIKLS